MNLRCLWAVWLLLAVLPAGCAAQVLSQAQADDAQLTEPLRKLAMLPPDACEAPGAEDFQKHPEASVYAAVRSLIERRLNDGAGSPEQRVHGALAEAMQDAATAQARWPEDARFRADVVTAGPALVVTMFVRTRARWIAFGKVAGRWKQVGEDEAEFDDSPRRLMQVYRLEGGRPGVARFLGARTFFGCAGSSGIDYKVFEWDSKLTHGSVEQVLAQNGAFGMDEAANGTAPSAKDPFAPIGKLVTDGLKLELPYCLFTGLDTWDNPSLCVLDRYDLRGTTIRFVSRRYNRPELVPIAKAMGYAAEHDLPATRSYCANDKLARRIVFEGTPGPDANVEVVRRGRGKRVWFGDRESWFDVEKRGGRWVLVGMSPAA